MFLEWTSKSKCTFLGTIFIDQFSRRLFCRLSIDPSSRDSIWSHAIYQCRHPRHCWSSSSLVRRRSSSSYCNLWEPCLSSKDEEAEKSCAIYAQTGEVLWFKAAQILGIVFKRRPDLAIVYFVRTLARPLYTELCTDTVDCIQCALCMVVVVARVSDCWELGSYAPSPLAASRPSCTD